jgi:hypothetical protein
MAKAFHALTKEQRLQLFKDGFLPKEIIQLDQSKYIDITTITMRRVIKDRRDWRDAMVLNGWTRIEIAKRINHWYRIKKQRSIWSLFRVEYGLTTNRPKLSRTEFKDFLQQRAEISRTFGRAYGRIKSVKLSQRYGLPGVPKKPHY